MIKKVAGAAAALALFAVGTVLLVGYVRSAEDRVVANELPTNVLVIDQPVDAGGKPSTRIEQVPTRLVLDDAVRPTDSTDGLVATVRLEPGEQLLWSRLGQPEEVATMERDRVQVPTGFLAVTIPISADRALGGLVVPGMRVGVVGSFMLEVDDPGGESQSIPTTNVLVHQALVVEVQMNSTTDNDDDAEPAASPTRPLPAEENLLVTLAVPIFDVERIVFAAEWGSIWLAEEDEDAIEEGSRIQTPSTIFDDEAPDVGAANRLIDELTSIEPRVLPLEGPAPVTDEAAAEPAVNEGTDIAQDESP